MILKIAAVILVIGGVWVWLSGRSITDDVEARTESKPLSLSAAAILAPDSDQGAFDQEGTIILDVTQGNGVPYLLYTDYTERGRPRVMTKRLVFSNQDACADVNLPCATAQPGAPVQAEEKVRIVGIVRDDLVEVSQLYRL